MKKFLSLALILVVLAACQSQKGNNKMSVSDSSKSDSNRNKAVKEPSGFYALESKTLDGKTFSFEQLRGKRVMIVNTASECGYTPQYEQLQELYNTYKDQNFTIIGFPSNDFGGQEPGSNEDIASFCRKNYGVEFAMMAKTTVLGDGQHAVYEWLTKKELNQVADNTVSWNFNKFLIDEKGRWMAYYPSKVSPTDERIKQFAAK